MAELERSLSFPIILLITINSIMGTGIFFLPALAAGEAGPASLISWAVMSVVAMLIAGIFAELSSMFPTAGGVYEYCKQAFGSFPSFLIGWTTLIVGNVTIAMLIVGAIRYLNPLLPTFFKVGFSVLFLVFFHYLAFRGMQTSAVMLIAFAIITLTTLFGLIVPGFFQFNVSNFQPFFTGTPDAVLLAIFLVAETFFGWETATFLAEETKNAKKVIPKALLWGTGIIVVIVMLFVLVSLSTIESSILGVSAAPLADMAAVLYGAMGSPVFSILVYISIIGSVAGWVVSAPRLMMAMAQDKLFLEGMSKIHEKHNTPYKAIIFQFFLTSILVMVGAGSYETLLHLLVPLVLIMYAAVALALLFLRQRTDVERPFMLPGGRIIALLVIVMLMGLVVFWALHVPEAVPLLRIIGSLLLFGIPVYWLLKTTYDPEAVIRISSVTGRMSLFFEEILLSKRTREKLLSDLELKGKRVIEFGSNVGTLTLDLAKKVGDNGIVYAAEVSESNSDLLRERLARNHIRNVLVVHDEHQINRLHPSLPQVDAIVSIGFLSYIQDLRKVLREMRERLPEHGVLLIAEYADYFKMLPNTGWVARPENLREIFAREGFAVRVRKQRGLLWNIVVVEGIRSDEAERFI